jgi:hypothetical protein
MSCGHTGAAVSERFGGLDVGDHGAADDVGEPPLEFAQGFLGLRIPAG